MADIRQIFLSHSVSSMGVLATTLNEKLRAQKFSTFICTSMAAGNDFRREITANAANCKIMIIFLDQNWATSRECLSEFNCAYSCFNKTESPQIVPIVIGGFQWIDPLKYPEAHCITANFQCLQKSNKQEWDDVFQNVINKIDALMRDMNEPAINSTAASDPKNQAFIEFVTCEIDQVIFKDPKMLPCNHSFCKSCLETWKESNGGGTFPCPKCRIPCSESINNLKSDFRANQLVEALKNKELISKTQVLNLNSGPSAPNNDSSNPEYNCEEDLSKWFTKNKIPKEVIDVLLNDGYEFLDIILDMTDAEIKDLKLKPGHERKLSKCIKEHKSLMETSFSSKPTARPSSSVARNATPQNEKPQQESQDNILDGWAMIEELYDDRALGSGTNPADSSKFWASLSSPRFSKIIDMVIEQANAVEQNPRMADSIKAKRLQQAAKVLCDVERYWDAKYYAKLALKFEESPEREYEIKALLVYLIHHRLKELWGYYFNDFSVYRSYRKFINLCNDVIKNQKYVGRAKLCKVYILKSFTIQSSYLKEGYKFKFYPFEFSFHPKTKQKTYAEAKEPLKEALKICDELKDDGLRAEATMIKGLLKRSLNWKFKSLKKARKLCLKEYGEFSILNARIYDNLGIDLEQRNELDKAYECYRRTWLIYRQILGPHHPTTITSGIVLDDVYRDTAIALKDSLPSTNEDPNANDRNYKERIQFLDSEP